MGVWDIKKRSTIIGFLFIPVVSLILFTYLPFVRIIISSFFSMSYTQNSGFVGIDNYVEVFENPQYNRAILVSGYYMVAAVVQVFVALILAVLLSRCRFSSTYKTLYVIPYMINGIAVGYIFKLFFTRGYVLDSVLNFFGIDLSVLPFWLRDQSVNNWSLAFASVWRYTGLSLIIFIGAIGAIERSVFEASSLDGANRWQQYKYIIWPNIKKVFYINLFLSIVSSLSEFELPFAIASGGSNGTATYMTLIYRIAFTERKIGLASAMVVVLLLQIILFTLLLLQFNKIANSKQRTGEKHRE